MDNKISTKRDVFRPARQLRSEGGYCTFFEGHLVPVVRPLDYMYVLYVYIYCLYVIHVSLYVILTINDEPLFVIYPSRV